MQELLLRKLQDYIRDNNLDVFMQLQMNGQLMHYLKEKLGNVDGLLNELLSEGRPLYLIEEACMEKLTADLRPSAFLYVCGVVEEEFQETEQRWKKASVFEFEIINLVQECKAVFEHHGFTEASMDDKTLRLAVSATIQEYLEHQYVIVNT